MSTTNSRKRVGVEAALLNVSEVALVNPKKIGIEGGLIGRR